MKIKVCGNTDVQQVHELAEAGADYAGFIFYEFSPRYILKQDISREIKKITGIGKVGVFVNAEEEEIMKQVDDFGLNLVQLHGDETASFCNRISERIKVIKAFRIADIDKNIDWLVKDYEESCDYYLFDKGSAGIYGGTGQKFNWDILSPEKINKPFFLSGGITINDVAALREFTHPCWYGVDVNSRFETAPGIKDMALVKEFMKQLKSF